MSYKEGKKVGDKTLGFLAGSIHSLYWQKEKRRDSRQQVPDWIKQIADSQTELLKSGNDEYFDNMQADFSVSGFTPKGDVVDLPIDVAD